MTDIEYGFGGFKDYYPQGANGAKTQKYYGKSISDDIIEFDFSQFSDHVYLWGYQKNVDLSGIQVYVKKGTF